MQAAGDFGVGRFIYPLAQAIAARYGETPNMAAGHGDFQSAFDCSKMRRFFGWTPHYSWREQ